MDLHLLEQRGNRTIPLFGLLENMSYIARSKARPPGRGERKPLVLEFGLRFIGELPMDYKAAEGVDAGDVRSLPQTDFEGTS